MYQPIPNFDLYRELEVDRHATSATIEAAWRSLAKRHHPDTALDKAAAVERMARLNVAHEWLTDPALRAHYDATRPAGASAPDIRNGSGTNRATESWARTTPAATRPRLRVSDSQFRFSPLKRCTPASGRFTVANLGGGSLSGSVRSNQAWLKVSPEALDPLRQHQEIVFTIDERQLQTKASHRAAIVLETNGGEGLVHVDVRLAGQRAALPALFAIGLVIFVLAAARILGDASRGAPSRVLPVAPAPVLVETQSAVIPSTPTGSHDLTPTQTPSSGGLPIRDLTCDDESTARSVEASESSEVVVVNDGSNTIRLFWIDYQGSRVHYADVGPGERLVQPTFKTHPWLIADLDGRCLALVLPPASVRTP